MLLSLWWTVALEVICYNLYSDIVVVANANQAGILLFIPNKMLFSCWKGKLYHLLLQPTEERGHA